MQVNVVVVVFTNYLELNTGLDLVLVANMLALSMDIIVADAHADVAGDDYVNVADVVNVDDGHLWSYSEAVRWVWLICLLPLW